MAMRASCTVNIATRCTASKGHMSGKDWEGPGAKLGSLEADWVFHRQRH